MSGDGAFPEGSEDHNCHLFSGEVKVATLTGHHHGGGGQGLEGAIFPLGSGTADDG